MLRAVLNTNLIVSYLLTEGATIYRSASRPHQQAYDAWLRLPPDERRRVPEPPRPSLGIFIEDKNGQKWVVDGRYLAMMDDLIGRLRKWLGSAG